MKSCGYCLKKISGRVDICGFTFRCRKCGFINIYEFHLKK